MYVGIISRVTNFRPMQGADRIQLATVQALGMDIADVIISKETQDNALGVYFGADCQLDEQFCKANKLTRADGGYLEENRRIKAIRFKGCKSEGLWLEITPELCIKTPINLNAKEGDEVGEPICRRYPKPEPKTQNVSGKHVKKVDSWHVSFPEHYDTPQLLHAVREVANIPEGTPFFITSKLHGTSHRVGNVKHTRAINWWQKIVNKVVYAWNGTEKYQSEKYELRHGTRRVILDPTNGNEGFYGTNQFRYDSVGNPTLARETIIYGEIVGWVSDTKTIMPDHQTKDLKELKKAFGDTIRYTYGCEPGKCEFYVYRVSQWSGFKWVDMRYDEMQKWITANHPTYKTPELLHTGVYDGNPQSLIDLMKQYAESIAGLYTPEHDHIREGVVLFIGNKAYKYKGYAFRVMDGSIKEVSIEDES